MSSPNQHEVADKSKSYWLPTPPVLIEISLGKNIYKFLRLMSLARDLEYESYIGTTGEI